MINRFMINRRTVLGAVASLAAPALLPRRADAGAWPSKPVRIVVPFTTGGATDLIARVMAARLQEVWGQPVTVQNIPGAGGNAAAEEVAKSAPDGSTIFIVGPGQAINKFMYASLRYDPVADFAPVTQLVEQPNVMAVPITSPVRSVQEFIAYCKANPGQVRYASAGAGTTLHLCGELFNHITGVHMQHVPYAGSQPALNDFLPGGVIDVIFDNVVSILPQVLTGNARGLAVTTAKRIAVAPKLPTLIEQGVPGFDVASWFAFFVPAKTPPGVVDAIYKDSIAALAHESVKPKLQQLGCEIIGSTPQALGAYLKSEIERWGPVIMEAHIRLEN
ncbi:MFS transporter [Afipia sp. P52-10]|uniref:Bug family tripartite tricarboxylate transporter substrate binding protein n=1 Tax=Afipia sp. P52-10 TaxID=1429916 RepID=UPI0003DF4602|nr:tripartite tricarboxylate transporter substrate binding protein [Afipia sp. P52-10]ETR77152.1 MFS transporter [Afipia sp. P52-10]